MIRFSCSHCGKTAEKSTGEINRAKKAGRRLFCSKICFGLDRRKWKTKAQKVAEKKAYDANRRLELADEIRARKAEYHRRTYDPKKAAVERKRRMPGHVEYCRRPEYRVWKSAYDERYRARRLYGEFDEVAMLLTDLQSEILSRQTRYEIDLENGKLNKKLKRRRAYVGITLCG